MKWITKMSFVTALCLASVVSANELKVALVEIAILCSPSEELENLNKVVSMIELQQTNKEEWKKSFIEKMEKVYDLIDKGTIHNAVLNIRILDPKVGNPQ